MYDMGWGILTLEVVNVVTQIDIHKHSLVFSSIIYPLYICAAETTTIIHILVYSRTHTIWTWDKIMRCPHF